MKKKLLSCVLAATLAMSATTVGFAAGKPITAPDESGVYGQDVEVTETTTVPTISVTIPTSTAVVINPYKLEVEMDGAKFNDAIITVEQTIVNESNVPISVSAKVKAAVPEGSGASVATAALKGTETTKSVFAYLEVAAKAAEDTPAVFSSDGYDAKSTKQVAFTTKEVTKTNMLTLAAATEKPTYAGFKIFGQASSTPTVAWTDADKVEYSITFNFVPLVSETAPTT